jgi:hypothetical protein
LIVSRPTGVHVCPLPLPTTKKIIDLWSGIDLSTWSDRPIDTGISRVPSSDTDLERRPRFFGTTNMHLQWLSDRQLVLRAMSQDLRIREVAAPVLLHPDLYRERSLSAGTVLQ